MSKDKDKDKAKLYPLPTHDPVTNRPLYVSELTSEESGITIRGRFAIPSYSQLRPEQAHFLEVFLRSRGTLSNVEKELGISYPTVRARLDDLLEALGLADEPQPAKRDKTIEKAEEKRKKILDQLEKGEISVAAAKAKLEGLK